MEYSNYDQTIRALAELDPYGVLEIHEHIQESVSETFEFQGREFTIEVPVSYLKKALEGRLEGLEPEKDETSTTFISVEHDDGLYLLIETTIEGNPRLSVTIEVHRSLMFFIVYNETERCYVLRQGMSDFSFSEMTGNIHREYPEVVPVTFSLEAGKNEPLARFFRMVARVV